MKNSQIIDGVLVNKSGKIEDLEDMPLSKDMFYDYLSNEFGFAKKSSDKSLSPLQYIDEQETKWKK